MNKRFLKDLVLDLVYFFGLVFLLFAPKKNNVRQVDESKPWLFISCFKIGDSLFLTSVYREIKNKFPGVRLWVLVNNSGARDILKNNPHIEKVIFVKNYLSGFIFLFKNITRDFGAIFDYSAIFYWSLIAKSLRHKFYLIRENQQKIGHFFFKNFEKFGWSRRYENQYIVNYYLSLVDFLGIKTSNNRMNIFFSADEAMRFKDKFSFLPEKYAIFHLSAGEPKNIWPYWAEFAPVFNKEFDLPVVFTGSDENNKNNSFLTKRLVGGDNNFFFLAGKTSLREALWLVSRAEFYIGGDTGITHAAISFDKKVVMIFGRASDKLYCPDKKNIVCLKPKTLCYPCYAYDNVYYKCPNPSVPDCTKSITQEDILAVSRKIYG
ncbi:MAG: glycosyltransferase family 9 protein [Patescibacteria group bacterium]|jgi:ADP-heptose:LPS heptosyltransferase